MSRINAYSMETRRPVTSAYAQAASSTSSTGYLVLSGTKVLRSSSSGACSETAKVTGIPSPVSRSIAGTRPTVETVTDRAEIPRPDGDGSVIRRTASTTER